jgi:hypothetical protein
MVRSALDFPNGTSVLIWIGRWKKLPFSGNTEALHIEEEIYYQEE